MRTFWSVLVLVTCAGLAGVSRAEAPADNAPRGPRPSREFSPSREAATRKALTTRRFSIDLQDVPLQDALEMLASRAGAGLAVDGRISAETLRQPLTLKLHDTSVYAVLHWTFGKRELAWAVDGQEIVVGSPETIDSAVAKRQAEFVSQAEKECREQITPKLNETRMSLDVVDVPLERVLALLSERAGFSLVWEGDVQRLRERPTNLKVSEAPVAQILDRLITPSGLAWSLEAEAVVVSPAKP